MGDAAVHEASDPGASRARHLHVRRRRRCHRLALSLPDAPPLSAAPSVEGGHRGRTRDCGREQMARPALRHRLHLCVKGRAGHDLGDAARIIDDIAEDAAALDCAAEVEHCRTIVDARQLGRIPASRLSREWRRHRSRVAMDRSIDDLRDSAPIGRSAQRRHSARAICVKPSPPGVDGTRTRWSGQAQQRLASTGAAG